MNDILVSKLWGALRSRMIWFIGILGALIMTSESWYPQIQPVLIEYGLEDFYKFIGVVIVVGGAVLRDRTDKSLEEIGSTPAKQPVEALKSLLSRRDSNA